MVERLKHTRLALTRNIRERIRAEEESLESQARELRRSMTARAERLDLALGRRAAEIEARSPLRALARGYAVVTVNDRIIRAPDEAPAGAPLHVRLAGGMLRARSEGPAPPPESDNG